MIKILRLRKRNLKYYWTVYDSFNGSYTDYSTNIIGQGLWKITGYGKHKQIVGTCDFIPPDSISGAYKYIRKYFET